MMAGIGVLILGHVLWVGVVLDMPYHEWLRLVLLCFPGVAAFFAAYWAPRNKILIGISMAVCGAAIAIVSSAVYESLGFHIDSIGTSMETFLIILIYDAALSVVGTAAGYMLSRGNKLSPLNRRVV